MTFIQRFGGINLNVHFHCVFLDRTEAGLKPRFVKGEPPSDRAIQFGKSLQIKPKTS